MQLQHSSGADESRSQLLARLQQFMDKTLRDLDKLAESKDSDEREVQAIRNVLLKIVRVWKEVVVNLRDEGRLVDAPSKNQALDPE